MVACYINGNAFISTGKRPVPNIFGEDGIIGIISGDSSVYISANSKSDRSILLQSRLDSIGICKFGSDYYQNGALCYLFTNGTMPTGDVTYTTDSLHGGSITYTYYDRKILAGTFQFDAVNGNGVVIHVTDGRFDFSNF